MRKITACAEIGPESLEVREFEVSENVTDDEITATAQALLGVSDDEDWWWTDDPDPFDEMDTWFGPPDDYEDDSQDSDLA